MKESKKREMQHKQKSVRDHARLRGSAGWLGIGGEGFVLNFRSRSSGGASPVEEDERRRVEDGAVMEEDRREDDITSYWNFSENSSRVE